MRNGIDPAEPEAPALLPCGCKLDDPPHGSQSVYWNVYNGVVQCHRCGQVYEPRTDRVPAQSDATWDEAIAIAAGYSDSIGNPVRNIITALKAARAAGEKENQK